MARRKSPPKVTESLEALGLSGLEAAAYAYLLAHSPATGYRVAQGIGKPVANTYKAIASLEEKGAVLMDPGSTRLCRAVPPEEFLARLEGQFQERRTRAARALAEVRAVEPEEQDPRVYLLRSRRQVMERARAILSRATRCALIDAFPDPLNELAGDIDQAAARGIDVVIKPYAECPQIRRAVMIPILQWEREIPALWPGHHLNLVADARESVLALLEPQGDGVVQAYTTTSTYLAVMQHSGVQFEMITTHVRDGIYKSLDGESLRAIVRGYLRFSLNQMPGYKTLLTGGQGDGKATGPRDSSP